METSTPLTPQQLADWNAHVLKEFPKEACAYIAGDKIVPVVNSSETPTTNFVVHPIERMKAEVNGVISGFLHSHPATPEQAGRSSFPVQWPTSHDMVSWLQDNIRWGISGCDGQFVSDPIWMDESYTAPLEGRPFIHGIWDCYAAVRDWFKVNKQITLKNYPRGPEWWYKGEDLYTTQFEDAGFRVISPSEVVPGDCALMNIHSKGVVCHAAVIVDDLMMYHHTFSRTGAGLSGYISRSRWAKHISSYVRYDRNA